MTDEAPSVQSALNQCGSSPIEYPHETALIVLSHVLGRPKTWIIAHPECYLNFEQAKALNLLCERLAQGEPLAYLTSKQAFFGLDFKVSPDVLIPRPETELLVETAINWLGKHPQVKAGLDVGTGSGCIPISILKHVSTVEMTAIDVSPKALGVAAENAENHKVTDRIKFLESDLLEKIDANFDFITANLPYIPTEKLIDLPGLSHEPKLALDGGVDGFSLIRRLLNQVPDHLCQPGLILLEIESTLGAEALQVANSAFPSAEVHLYQDLAGLDRLIAIEVI